jgi:low molecular weight phosphotyrosine protein phosphatase
VVRKIWIGGGGIGVTRDSAMSESSIKVLVVCLGNICRSPIGAAVLRNVATKRGLDILVDSAGTSGYHVGEDPDKR